MIKFDISKHTCHTCVICCMDFRIYMNNTLHDYLVEQKIDGYDLIAVPGAGKALLGRHSELVLDAIKISMELHSSKELYLIHHIDCGAYGGSKSFVSREAELGKHKYEMETARQIINSSYDIPVKKILFDESNGKLNPIEL